MTFREQLHPSWREVLDSELDLLDEIEERVSRENFLPSAGLVMRALSDDFALSKVLILGQDPYPNPTHPVGLAFAIPAELSKFPPTLKNIFKELSSDLQIPSPVSGDLTPWSDQGVVLLNRSLTCRTGESNSHVNAGWREFTDSCVQKLARAGRVGILWGANAQELSRHFSDDKLITSAHPSPLSAYRGFFGSKPFSRANQLLLDSGIDPVNWRL
jgi:uracil-DNA glycosylase